MDTTGQPHDYEKCLAECFPKSQKIYWLEFGNQYGDLSARVKSTLDKTNDVYKMLKSGDNPGETSSKPYKPSYLMKRYAKNNTKNGKLAYGNEKKQIKLEILQQLPDVSYTDKRAHFYDDERIKMPEDKEDKYLFARALLGLADHYEFRDIEYVVDKPKFMRNLTIDISSDEIKRFKSPLTFKAFPDEAKAYIIPNEISKDMYSKPFTFQAINRELETSITNNNGQPIKPITVKTPCENNFSLIGLLDAFIDDVQKGEYVISESGSEITIHSKEHKE
ncbi:MAG: hypothetical protein FWG10_14720 [Eubacteriaceae bacterium]|nr:hypothetical protein [Eubacteriaceae bacterium]